MNIACKTINAATSKVSNPGDTVIVVGYPNGRYSVPVYTPKKTKVLGTATSGKTQPAKLTTTKPGKK